jgi:hypothetical protein
MRIGELEINEFTDPQSLINLTMWMLQGLAMRANGDNSKLLAAFNSVAAVFDED